MIVLGEALFGHHRRISDYRIVIRLFSVMSNKKKEGFETNDGKRKMPSLIVFATSGVFVCSMASVISERC